MKKDSTWKIKMERIRRSKLWAGDMSRIALIILDYLEDHGKTQRWLSEQLGVSPQQVNKIVKGRQNLSWGKLKEIEDVLGIKLVGIIGESESNIQEIDGNNKEIYVGKYDRILESIVKLNEDLSLIHI